MQKVALIFTGQLEQRLVQRLIRVSFHMAMRWKDSSEVPPLLFMHLNGQWYPPEL